jgi:hypothetical protein
MIRTLGDFDIVVEDVRSDKPSTSHVVMLAHYIAGLKPQADRPQPISFAGFRTNQVVIGYCVGRCEDGSLGIFKAIGQWDTDEEGFRVYQMDFQRLTVCEPMFWSAGEVDAEIKHRLWEKVRSAVQAAANHRGEMP